MASQWQRRGENIVNAGIDFIGGVGSAFRGVGGRLKRGKHQNLIEAFCAVAGDVASQNGRILPGEIESFRRFLLDNHDNPFISAFSADELIEKFRGYGIAAFLGEEETFVRVISGIDPGDDEGKLVILGALAVAFADGECDMQEAECIVSYARRLNIDLDSLAQEFRIKLPDMHQHDALERPVSVLDQAASAPPPPPPLSRAAAPAPAAPTTEARKPLCKRCWAFLIAGQPRCDCGRDLSNDYPIR